MNDKSFTYQLFFFLIGWSQRKTRQTPGSIRGELQKSPHLPVPKSFPTAACISFLELSVGKSVVRAWGWVHSSLHTLALPWLPVSAHTVKLTHKDL